jgi:hypothetical protein
VGSADGACKATRRPRLGFTLPHGYHEPSAVACCVPGARGRERWAGLLLSCLHAFTPLLVAAASISPRTGSPALCAHLRIPRLSVLTPRCPCGRVRRSADPHLGEALQLDAYRGSAQVSPVVTASVLAAVGHRQASSNLPARPVRDARRARF